MKVQADAIRGSYDELFDAAEDISQILSAVATKPARSHADRAVVAQRAARTYRARARGSGSCGGGKRRSVSAEDGDAALVSEVQEKTKELGRLLDEFSERLRRMRARNRQLEQEIGSFEEDLDRLRRWLTEQT